MTNKPQVITMEMFDQAILPRIDELFEEKLQKYQNETINEVASFKSEVCGELQKLREEVSTTNHLYKKTNERVDLIDKELNIDTSVVF